MNAGVQGLDVSVRARAPDWSLESVSGASPMRWCAPVWLSFDCEGCFASFSLSCKRSMLFFMKVYIRTVNTCTIYVPSNSLTFDCWTPKHWWQACSTEESPHKYFVRWALIHHLVLESSQGFVAQSQCLFEFTHEWRIKGCSDDRESIKITWKFAEWQGAKFLQTRRLKVAVCLLVLASPSVNQIISRSDVEGDQQ